MTGPAGAAPPPAWVRTATTDDLCLVWRRSHSILVRVQSTGGVGSQAAIIGLRQACLDELERRHPVEFARWLAESPHPADDLGHVFRPPVRTRFPRWRAEQG